MAQTLDHLVTVLANRLIAAKKDFAVAVTEEKQLSAVVEAESATSAEWTRRAEIARTASDGALAKEALERAEEHERLASSYRAMLTQHARHLNHLREALRALNRKIEATKRHKNLVLARCQQLASRERMANVAYEIRRTVELIDATASIATGEEPAFPQQDELCSLCAARYPFLGAVLDAARAGNEERAARLLSESLAAGR